MRSPFYGLRPEVPVGALVPGLVAGILLPTGVIAHPLPFYFPDLNPVIPGSSRVGLP